MKSPTIRSLSLGVALLLAACGDGVANETAAADEQGHAEGEAGRADSEETGHTDEEGLVTLTPAQIAAAGIRLGQPIVGGAGAIDAPATIEGDPQGTQVVSAAIGGRIVALNRNLGQSVGRGQTLAVIESREAAQLQGEVEAARARLALANSNLSREQRLFAERVSPEQDLVAARTAATEASIAYRLARQQLSASGGSGGALNRIAIASPISGQVIARPVVLGQTVVADAELYRVANLARVSLALNLRAEDAGRVAPGAAVLVTAPGRQASARISFVSPALDPETRLVPAIATLDNRAGQWRVGEPVSAAVQLSDQSGITSIRVPAEAIQTVAGASVVFIRTPTGFRATPVVVGDAAGDTVVIRSGLAGHERIAIAGTFILKAELGKSDAGHGGH